MAESVSLDRILAARERIAPHVVVTPTRHAPDLGLWLKLENRQRTGSFKLRGALARLLALDEDAARRGIVAASAGNHGLGVAYAARLREAKATIVVPEHAVEAKVEAIRREGAQLRFAAGGYAEAEAEGKRLAEEWGAVWVSPYNDPEVIAGQGTIGLELVEQLGTDRLGHGWEVFIPVSGGGLACGIGLALKALAPGVRVVGVQPEACPYMYAHFHGEDPTSVVERPTLADGLAGAVEEGSITFDLLPPALDDVLLVDEDEILEAMRQMLQAVGEVIEPSAAAAVAAALWHGAAPGRVVIVSGGNVDRGLLERLQGSEA
ncbi:MAG: threonine/serine dehydratase [Chloroflexota bacterium]